MAPQSAIFGCASTELTGEEIAFFRKHQPFGFILFARNCDNPAQLRHLVRSLRDCVDHDQAPIFIDQEGGRVARLKPPHWGEYPPACIFADLWGQHPCRAERACHVNAVLMADELQHMGINADCAPLADLRFVGAHDVIGDRAFGESVESVVALARAQANGLMERGVLPVLKHIPGHGRAMADSHHDLPVVDTPLAILEQTDFVPFRSLRDLPFAMTAHIRFTALDADAPVTLSCKAIDYIRHEIGFTNLLMSDDISMKALQGDIDELSAKALDAGCDLILHCNGKMDEMQAVAAACSPMSAPRFAAFQQYQQQIVASAPVEREKLKAEYDALLAVQMA